MFYEYLKYSSKKRMLFLRKKSVNRFKVTSKEKKKLSHANQ